MKNKQLFSYIFIAAFFFSFGCSEDLIRIEGSGPIVTETLDLPEFTRIRMLGLEDVEISYGEVQKVEVRGHENIIRRIVKIVKSGKWDIELEKGKYSDYELKYFITIPQINEISNEGMARIIVNDFINTGDLEINISGMGRVELNRMENTANLDICIEGLGSVYGYGEFRDLKTMDIIIDGSGYVLTYPIISNNCYIDIEGTGKCEVSVSDMLDVNLAGAGVVHYKGTASVSKQIAGIGIVQQVND